MSKKKLWGKGHEWMAVPALTFNKTLLELKRAKDQLSEHYEDVYCVLHNMVTPEAQRRRVSGALDVLRGLAAAGGILRPEERELIKANPEAAQGAEFILTATEVLVTLDMAFNINGVMDAVDGTLDRRVISLSDALVVLQTRGVACIPSAKTIGMLEGYIKTCEGDADMFGVIAQVLRTRYGWMIEMLHRQSGPAAVIDLENLRGTAPADLAKKVKDYLK